MKSFLNLWRALFFLIIHSVAYGQTSVEWSFQTRDRVYSSPLIDGDIVYFGSGDKSFYALNKSTGEEIWRFETKGAVHSSPSSFEDLVLFGSADGFLYALNKLTGDLVWQFQSEGEKMYGLWDYYLSSPIVDDQVVYWASGDGNLYTINTYDGSLKWKFKTDDIIHASAVFDEEKVYIGGFDGNFYAIDKEAGDLVWKFKTIGASYFPKGEIQKAALLDNGVLYFGSRDYNIYAVNSKTGRGMWNMKQPRGWIIATPFEYKDQLYFGSSDAHLMFCMDKQQGTINWSIPLNMRVYGTATVYEDIIYFGTFDGKVLGVDYATGAVRWQFQTESSKANYSKVFNDKGEFRDDFQLYGQDYLESEALIHELGSILSSPTIDNGIIYFGSSDGRLYALNLK